MFKFLIVVMAVLATPALANGAPPPFSLEKEADHALTGKIWSVRERQFISPEALAAALGEAQYALLGEKHTNPDHHALQAWAVEQVLASDRRVRVVLEMVPQGFQEKIDAYLAQVGSNAAGFGAAVEWEARGWPSYAMYQPIMEAAFAREAPLVAGDVSVEKRKRVGAGGLDDLGDKESERLNLKAGLSPQDAAVVEDLLFESHCALVPRQALQPMRDVQLLRDASLAEAMLSGGGDERAVLIAGAGHVRGDFAVPMYLRARAPEASIAIVAFVEARAEKMNPEDYIPASSKPRAVYDYMWFTPAVIEADPCIDLKKRFGAKAK